MMRPYSFIGSRNRQVLFLAVISMALVPAIAFAQGLLPDGAKDIFALLVAWPRTRVEYIFLAAAWCGVFAHWWNKRRLGELAGNFAAYLLAERKDSALSALTVMLIYGAIMGLIAAGLVANAAWPGAAIGGLAIGWVIDAILSPKVVANG